MESGKEKNTNIFARLCAAQKEFFTLPKDKEGYGYRYTDFDTVVSAVRPVLAKHGLGFSQFVTGHDGRLCIRTVIFSDEGESIEDSAPLPEVSVGKSNAAQNVGAAITYMRRYCLCAALGLSSDEDTDGVPPQEHAAKPSAAPQPGKARNTYPPKGDPVAEAEKKRITDEISATLKSNWQGAAVFTDEDRKRFRSLYGKMPVKEILSKVKKEYAEKTEALKASVQKEPEQIPFPEDDIF